MRRICRSLSRRWFEQINRGRIRRERRARRSIHLARGFGLERSAQPAPDRGPGGARRPSREPLRASQKRAGAQATGGAAKTLAGERAIGRRSAAPQLSSSSTGSADSPTTGGTMWRPSKRDSGRPRPGSMSSATVPSAFRCRSRAAAIPGRSIVSRTSITPWSNDPVGDAPGEVIYLRDEDTGNYGARRLFPSARTPRHTSLGMVRAIAGSSMSRMALRSSCCNTCRLTIRSRFPG